MKKFFPPVPKRKGSAEKNPAPLKIRKKTANDIYNSRASLKDLSEDFKRSSEKDQFDVKSSEENGQKYQSDYWESWLCENMKKFPDLARLIQIVLIFGANSSVVEQFFSIKAAVETKKRKSLKAETTEKLCLVAHNGPPLKKFRVDEAVKVYKKIK